MCEFGGLTPLKEIPNSLSPLWDAAKKAVLYKSWCYGVYYQLEGNWLGCADRVEKYLQVTCLELCPHGRLRQCCQPGCPPCFLPTRGWRSCRGCVTADSPACGSWGNVISCRDQEQLARNSSHLWSWNSNDRNKEALWEQKLQGLTLSVWGFKIILVCYRHCCITAF